MENLERYVQEHRFFKGMRNEHLELLAGCAKNVRYDVGDTLFDEGATSDSFFLIRHGQVGLELSAPGIGTATLQTCSEGAVIGWSWLIAPHRWRYTGRATQLTRALEMDGACIRNKCKSDLELGYDLMERFSGVLAHRLESTRLQLLDVFATKGGALSS